MCERRRAVATSPRERRHRARSGRSWRDIHRQADAAWTAIGGNSGQPDRAPVIAVNGLHGAIAESVRRVIRVKEKRLGTTDRAEIADLTRSTHLEKLDPAAVERLDAVIDLL